MTHIAIYDPFVAQLNELREFNAKQVFDYADPKGNKEARSHIHKLRRTKGAVEQARKEEKQASLEYGRAVDKQAKEIIGELDGMIEVHAAPIREIEQREEQRIQSIKDRISTIESMARDKSLNGEYLDADTLESMLTEVFEIDMGDGSFAEFESDARRAKGETMDYLEKAIAVATKREAEAAELERLRREQAEREEREREERIRREAVEKARQEAEAKAEAERKAAAEKAEQERKAQEQRELQLRMEKENAERRAAEAERRTKEELDAKKRAEDEARRKREENQRHRTKVNNQAVKALVKGGLSDEQARTVVTMIAAGDVPHITINY